MTDNTDALPPLPQPLVWTRYSDHGPDGAFTADQMRDYARAALAQRQQVPELWLVVRESVLDVGQGDDARTGGRPELGYALIANAATFTSEGEARAAIRAAGLPIGWVYMPLSRLLPDLHERINGAPALSAAPSAQAEPQVPLPFNSAQRRRLWDNSPEIHADAKSFAAFERIVQLVESAHGIGKQESK